MAKPSESLADYAREEALIRRLDRLVRAEVRGVDPRWVEQAFSPLGPRKHIAAVRRRIAEAEAAGRPSTELGAAMRGSRTYLLTPESIAEELARREPPKKRRVNEDADAEERAYAEHMASINARKAVAR